MVEDRPQPQTLDRDSRNTRVMSRLKESILSQLDPSRSPSLHTANHFSFLQSRLQHLFESFHTPTHPPYALMIRKALTELNDGSGSTEESISEFILKEYEDLPWSHTKILDFHLKRLCQVEELLFTEDGRYMLPVDDGEGERTGAVESVEIREQLQKESSIDCRQQSSEYIISTLSPCIEVSSPTRLQPQISPDINLGGVSKMKASLTCVTVDDDDDELPQHYNQGDPEGNLDENPMSRRFKQKIPKGPRGRPRKTKTVANSQEESSFNKQGSIANNTVKQGRGRPRKVNHDTEPCGEQSQPEDQAKPRGRSRGGGGGGGRGRGRGRGEGVNQDTEQCVEESHPEYQAKPRGKGRDEGVNQDIEQCEEQSHSDEQGGEGVNQDIEQCEEQSLSEDRAKPSGRGRGGGRGRGRGGGRGRSGNRGRGRPAVRKI